MKFANDHKRSCAKEVVFDIFVHLRVYKVSDKVSFPASLFTIALYKRHAYLPHIPNIPRMHCPDVIKCKVYRRKRNLHIKPIVFPFS